MPGRSGQSSDLGLGEGRSRPWNVLLKCDGYAFENYADAMSAGGHALAAQ
jgi:hypothetical protein